MIFAVLALALQVTATNADSIAWDYAQTDIDAGTVAQFLVCLDGQPTAACATVPVSAGTAAPLRTYTWKLPALTPGAHRVAVQACTAGCNQSSSGVLLQFTVQVVLANPAGLRLVKAGG